MNNEYELINIKTASDKRIAALKNAQLAAVSQFREAYGVCFASLLPERKQIADDAGLVYDYFQLLIDQIEKV